MIERGPMYNETNESKVLDVEECVALKKDLLQQALALKETEDLGAANQQLFQLRKAWRKIPNFDSLNESELQNEFDEVISYFHRQQAEIYKQMIDEKTEIINQVKALTKNADKAASETIATLMEKWKQIPRTTREQDDELWARFQDARNEFFGKRKNDWENMQQEFATSKQKKEALIEQAKQNANIENFKEGNEIFDRLMQEWKDAGRSGREDDDALWQAFQEARQVFYDRRNAYYEKLHAAQDQAASDKQALIDEAKAILERAEFTSEDTNTMKQMMNRWKQTGFARGNQDQALWETFRSTLDDYFAKLKQAGQQRHLDWVNRQNEQIDRKRDLISRTQRNIKFLHDKILETLSEDLIEDIKDEIAEKEDFIKELETQIKEIEEHLQK